MGDGRPDELRYTAFLSYSHKDAAAAGRVHRRLETYRMPRRLVGAETARGPVPARLAPIFRDREELPAATDLSKTVREALAQSGALIVLCSPAAAESLWVAEEIEIFRKLHPGRPVLAAVLGGDPPDCFPLVLRAFGRDGTWHEPLATDLRRHRDGGRLGLLKLVAGITGVGLDALVQRDASRRVRRVMAVTGAALVAMLAMLALALVALNARHEAEGQRAEAEGLVEFMHGDLRRRLDGVHRLDIMRTVNQRVLAYYDRQLARFDRPADRLMRARILQAFGQIELESGRQPDAVGVFGETYRTTAELLAAAPNDPDRIFGHAQSEYWLGFVAYMREDYPEARRRLERYRDLAGQLLAIDPSNPAWTREAAYAEGNLCSLAQAEQANPRALLGVCRESLRLMDQVHRALGDDETVIFDLANRHAWVADAWVLNGRWDEALNHRRQQERLVRLLIARAPSNLEYQDVWMRTQFTYGTLLVRRGRAGEARRWFQGAAATAARLHASDPENATWREWEQRTAARARGSTSN
jgi:tetratricopeptide (TPR) repeat protein